MGLRARTLPTLAVAALACGSLVIPSSVSAAPVGVDEYNAAFAQALEQSGLLAPGTTVTEKYADLELGMWYVDVVNPDGSLTSTSASPETYSQVRCVRRDRCWRRDALKYGDNKWHLLSKGSIKYIALRSFGYFEPKVDETPETQEWVESFDVDAVATGGGVFGMTYTFPEGTTNVSGTLAGPHLAIVVTVAPTGSVASPVETLTLDSQTARAHVKAPPRNKIGKPAPADDTSFTVLIN